MPDKKRYNLVMPQELFDQLEEKAQQEGTTVINILKRYIRVGLFVEKVLHDSNSSLIIREGDQEREIAAML